MLLSSCYTPILLRLSKSTHFSFVPWELAVGTHSQILLFHFPSIQHTVQCVSALPVQITRAGYLAVLHFFSLLTLTPFLLLVSWGMGGVLRSHRVMACISPS